MAYDVELADRLRDILAAEPAVVEKRMFGGLVFMVAGYMAVAVTGGGGLMVRVSPDQSETLLLDPRATRMVMQGRQLAGWLLIDLDAVTDEELTRWVDLGVDHAHSLPPR